MTNVDTCYGELRRMAIDAKRSWEIWPALSNMERKPHPFALVLTSGRGNWGSVKNGTELRAFGDDLRQGEEDCFAPFRVMALS
jgi:hypothetical protein